MKDTIHKILDRIVDFFSIFDISFLISGIATMTLLCYGAWLFGLFTWLGDGFAHILYYVILSYICGLASFAFGKWIRTTIIKRRRNRWRIKWIRTYKFKKIKIYLLTIEAINKENKDKSQFMECFSDAILYVNHKSTNPNQKLPQYEKEKDAEKHYTEMWYYIREHKNKSLTYQLLNRYWVSQAIYDGLLFPAFIAFLLGVFVSYSFDCFIGVLISISALLCGYFFYKEGKRYAEAQIKEVVIVYYNLKNQHYEQGKEK